MCNAYDIGGKAGSYPGFLRAEAVGRLEEFVERRLIRRTDVAPVVTKNGEVEMMSWGFRRKGLGVVNNSRSDNLESPMWREAYEKRRCLIPVAGYFEWKGPKGKKETYRFEDRNGTWLWMAGIWEQAGEGESSFSMLTTTANRVALPIHHRMPVMIGGENLENYLRGDDVLRASQENSLVVACCENPLLKRPRGIVQEELF